MESFAVNFGKSQFKGRDDFQVEFKRWMIQVTSLILKNFIILWRRPLQLFLILLLPSTVMFTFLIEHAGGDSSTNDSDKLYPSEPIKDLGKCDVYYSDDCVRVVYGPNSGLTTSIMDTFCAINNLKPGLDVIGFDSTLDAEEYVAQNIGKVQFTVLFRNSSLWETPFYSPNLAALPKNMSYVIFYNSSENNDARSSKFDVNFPLLVLQKTLDESYMRVTYPDNFTLYEVNYGELWDLERVAIPDIPTNNTANSTNCDLSTRPNMDILGTTLPWVITFAFLLLSNLTFQMVAEEKRKKLFMSLRRLGLLDSAYWASWFFVFQIILLAACAIAMIVGAIIRSKVASLGAIDFSVLYLLLWLSGSASIAFSCFLAAFCSSSSIASSLAFFQFVVALITISMCGTPLNTYGYGEEDGICYFETSSYNYIYSKDLLGSTFVQFLVFFLPWFHSSQAITNMISHIQYEDRHLHMNDLGSPILLTSSLTTPSTFDSKWIGWNLRMLVCVTVVYMVLAWFSAQVMSSDETEGRSILTVLIPPFLRKILFKENEVVLEGDIRGEEKGKSKRDGSVRAYKVSKTYSGVQALKEVSFSMKRGECFVMLGHNGAGKSTLINIITGVIAPTHGKVYLCGLDVETDAAQVQQTIGVCPQDDILWDDLTAKEHMLLTAAFKGLEWGPQLLKSVESVLNMVQLLDRCNDFAKQYSGGMKRRLSVAMSTVGDVEILFLDEPTTGLDPVSRRHVWEAINWMKRDRVVVLTTHNMEEADFLGDTIMIMHTGHVRAFGDPLFLKQTYGKGYHVNITVHKQNMRDAQAMISQALPGSHCDINENSGGIIVTVPRGDIRGLPRLFAWLESSNKASTVVKEWGVSNTTLEQVFLMLCVQNTEVNYVAADDLENFQQVTCPMCHIRPKETVFMRNVGNQLLILPESICYECSLNNRHYFVTEAEMKETLQAEDKNFKTKLLLTSAQLKAESAATKLLLDAESKEINEEFEADGWERSGDSKDEVGIEMNPIASDSDMLQIKLNDNAQQEVRPHRIISASNNGGDPYGHSAHGTVTSQIRAVCVKNVLLQSRQRCSNICSVLFVGLMFMMLYIVSLIFSGVTSIDQCDQGYLTNKDCELSTITRHIFSSSYSDMTDDWFYDDDAVAPQGYNIDNYLIPNTYGATLYGNVEGDSRYGIPYFNNRQPILWTNLISSDTLQSFSSLSVSMRALPDQCGNSLNGPNEAMLGYQSQVKAEQEVSDYPDCEMYTDIVLGSNTSFQYQQVQEYSEILADVSFACPSCKSIDPGDISTETNLYFNGTFWMPNVPYNCYDFNCYPYPYGIVDYTYDYVDDNTFFYGEECPAGRYYFSMNGQYYNGQQLATMSYLNLLSNLMVQPQLQTYNIQGAYSNYGDLTFDELLISQVLANILTVVCMMLLNGFWPIAVWRLSHERSLDIVLMMRTVGMRPISYISGMFLFDMVISVISGLAMIGFAVGLKLSSFDGAPVGYLLAIVLLSAFAFNSISLLAVTVLGKKSSILPMLAPCLCVAATAGASLINILIFPNDGDWKWPLSLFPFFAQGRAIYIILVYHRTSSEVDISLALLFLFGLFCLVATYILEEDVPVINLMMKYLDIKIHDKQNDANVEQKLLPKVEQYHGVDNDVIEEKKKALKYVPSNSTPHVVDGDDSQENKLLAIVIQMLYHKFDNKKDEVAVKELSLGLSFGECFGLLGPNGAGKSTTMSVLCGTLRATGGKQYVAGKDLSVDTTSIHQYVGVCPQFDVVWPDLTVAEHLAFQARQRGVLDRRLEASVQQAAVAVGLDGDGFFTKAGELSGGMRRRLSIAMSIVGDPPIIFMDEPTTGLDPDNRQQVWKIVQSLKQPNRLILMTTHSMEEAEALCTRIGIMAKGELKCIGSAQHLKSKYGKGYTLTVNLNPSSNEILQQERLISFIKSHLSRDQAILLSSINRTQKFLLPREHASSVSEIFKQMELKKNQLEIREWGLSLSTLEDVFISAVS